ncbi:MAG: ABC transporter substrate-binding protein [Myxococcales bacterium]|nr:ABC transporter substrate-binding protein [Myxococcales bacterium]
MKIAQFSKALTAVLVCTTLFAPAVLSAAPKSKRKKAKVAAVADESPAMHKTLKRMIGAIRYKRSAKALAQFSGPTQGAFLAGSYWAKASPAQKTEFVALFHKMFAGIAFPNIQKNFKNLETVLYSKAKIRGTNAKVDAVIVILHPMKKQEIQATFDLTKVAGTWKVVDVTVKGNPSMLTRIRDDQVQKILAKGGFPKLLTLLKKRTAKLK